MLLLENKFWKIIQARQTCLSIQLSKASIMIHNGNGYKTYDVFEILSRGIEWRGENAVVQMRLRSQVVGTCLC